MSHAEYIGQFPGPKQQIATRLLCTHDHSGDLVEAGQPIVDALIDTFGELDVDFESNVRPVLGSSLGHLLNEQVLRRYSESDIASCFDSGVFRRAFVEALSDQKKVSFV